MLQETVAGTKLDADAVLEGLQKLALAAEARLRGHRASSGLGADGQAEAPSSGTEPRFNLHQKPISMHLYMHTGHLLIAKLLWQPVLSLRFAAAQ